MFLFTVSYLISGYYSLDNTVVVAGSQTLLICTANESVKLVWYHFEVPDVYSLNNHSRELRSQMIFNGLKLNPNSNLSKRVTVNNSVDGQIQLIINTTKLTDAGQYRCRNYNEKGRRSDGQLIVLGKKQTK